MSSITASVDEMQVPDLPIAADLPTQRASEATNKYKYPEFEGFTGERYLYALAQRFAPFALWRTWWAMVSYEAHSLGLGCYVGVELVVNDQKGRVGVQARKVYKDLEALQDRGWLRLERVRRPFPQDDGSVVWHTATIKDFTGFYDCAHQYHLWLQDKARYIAPLRENRSLIQADPALEAYLLQFENYRRIIMYEKPGPKTEERGTFIERQIAALADLRSSVLKVNLSVNSAANSQPIEGTAYKLEEKNRDRNPEKGSTNIETDSNLSTLERNEGPDGEAIGKISTESSPGTETRRTTEQQDHLSKTNPPTPQKEEGAAAGDAIDDLLALGYTEEELKRDIKARAAALVGIPADQHRKLNGGLDQAEEVSSSGAEPPRPLREFPDTLGQAIIDFAAPYDDQNLLGSDETRVKKLYATAEQAIPYFNDKYYWPLFDAAKAAGLRYARTRRNSKGRVTPVPYAFTCLENALGITLEELVYMRTDDPLYTDYALFDFIDRLREMHQEERYQRQTVLGYREWLEELLDQIEKRKEHKERKNPTQRKY